LIFNIRCRAVDQAAFKRTLNIDISCRVVWCRIAYTRSRCPVCVLNYDSAICMSIVTCMNYKTSTAWWRLLKCPKSEAFSPCRWYFKVASVLCRKISSRRWQRGGLNLA